MLSEYELFIKHSYCLFHFCFTNKYIILISAAPLVMEETLTSNRLYYIFLTQSHWQKFIILPMPTAYTTTVKQVFVVKVN